MGEERAPEEELQFDTAEAAQTSGATERGPCAACKRTLGGSYFEANGKPVCRACGDQLQALKTSGVGGGVVFAKAAGMGLVAALIGSIVWYAIRAATGWEIGLVAIGVGIVVGIAVRSGSGGRGGWAYQALAMFLTYNAAAMNYAPDVLEGLRHANHDVAAQSDSAEPATAEAAPPPPSAGRLVIAFVMLYGLLLAVPFLGGADNLIGLIIIGIGVYQAWKLNKRPKLELTGPYRLEQAAAD